MTSPRPELGSAAPVQPMEPVACDAPGPLVVNGGMYAGCNLPLGHPGKHQVVITWGS